METKPKRLIVAAVGLIAAVGLAVGLAVGVWARLGGPPPAGQVSVSPDSIDFGDIIQSEGPVSTTVEVTNVGPGPLTINRLSASCGCTAAMMDMSQMAPGQTRTMTITFDPMVHPDQFGPITRVVYLQTTDPDRPEVEINVTGNVLAGFK